VFAADEAARLNPNSASDEQLNTLPHLGEAEIAAIVARRPFATIGELNAALSDSLAEDQLNELYGQLFVPISLNSASEADILLIPGVGKRMAHEFEEYRPYKSMDQFRREIGKYVDEEEVARLETYVTLD
jgi:DNA uptake protein ComE-like DNA-binding protein